MSDDPCAYSISGTQLGIVDQGPGGRVQVRGLDLRVVIAATAAWVTVALGVRLGSSSPSAGSTPLVVAAGLALILAIVAAFLLPRPGSFLVLTVLSATATGTVGLAAGLTAGGSFLSDSLTELAEGGNFVRVIARVSAEPEPATTPWPSSANSVRLEGLGVQIEGEWVPAAADLWGELPRFLDKEQQGSVEVGGIVLVRGVLSRADWLSAPTAGRLRVVDLRPLSAPAWTQRESSRLRRAMRMQVAHAGRAGPLISGMAIGDDAGLDGDIKKEMLISSLTHLTAVSGSHIAMTLALITRLLRGRTARTLATILFLVVIVAVVGPEPSVIRAAAMSGLTVWGFLRRRPGQPLGLLGAVVLGSVLLDPWLAISVGFALSVLATAGIILLGRPLEQSLMGALPDSRRMKTLGVLVVPSVAVSLSASVATLPVLALINPWLPTWGVLANLLVAPVVAPLTILGLLVALTCLWSDSLSSLLVSLATPPANWLIRVADWTAGLPLAQLPFPQGLPGFCLAWVPVVLLSLVVLPRSHTGRGV